MNLNEFALDFFQNILDELSIHGQNAEEVFVDRMCNYLADNGIVENVDPSFWLKSAQGIKVNAYSYNQEERRLSLFVAFHEMPYDKMKTISRTDVERTFKRSIKFFEYSSKRDLKESIEESNQDAYDLASLIESESSNITQLDLFLLTNCVYKSNDVMQLTVEGVKTVNFHVWDIERLYQLVNETQGINTFTLDFAKDFGESFQMMLVPSTSEQDSQFDCYIGYIPGTLLAKAYEELGQRLIERNVRSFLQARGKVNKGIKETLQNRKEMFIAFNNGISTTADDSQVTKVNDSLNLYEINRLTGWQIVNGGQTTASLYHAWDSGIDISGVHVQAKLTVLKTTEQEVANELISRISQYANTQNKISFSDLGANDSLHIQLEQVSRTIWAPDPQGRKSNKKWYYERARGQYLVDLSRQPTTASKNKFKSQNPKDHVITKTQFAKYFMTWEQLPHLVSKGNESNFTDFMQHMSKKKIQVDSDFFKQAISKGLIFNSCYEIVRKMDLPGFKANVVYYTVAMLSHVAGDQISLIEVWNKQNVDSLLQDMLSKTALITRQYLSEKSSKGINVSQWCKKEECWKEFKMRFSNEVKQIVSSSIEVASGKG